MKLSITTNSTAPTGSITDKVKSFEDACNVLGITGSVAEITTHDKLDDAGKGIQAFIKLQIIAAALNEGWKPDWNDTDTRKFYPYFDLEDGFSLDIVDCNFGSSDVSSRLCFKTEALAQYAGSQFLDLYKDFMLF